MAKDYYQKVRGHLELERQSSRESRSSLVATHREPASQYKMVHRK